MDFILRPAVPVDAPACGRICYEAFRAIATHHNFPPPLPSPAVATEWLSGMLAHPAFYGVVAEVEGHVVGSNFLDERATIVGLGPITVDPASQNHTIGRQLMQHALARAAAQGRAGVRLAQDAYHTRSLCLYTKLGFEARELLAIMQGPPLSLQLTGFEVRPALQGDRAVCDQLCRQVHGYERSDELHDAILQGTATVVEHDGAITGYATLLGISGHAVGTSTAVLQALIGAASSFSGPGFLLPTRNGELFRWCLQHGLRVVSLMTYMSLGLYNEPTSPWLPSVLS
jgi:predicted N-acetyltransferase YhbS